MICAAAPSRPRTNVVGDIDVFGESPDDAVRFRQRSPALEDQVLGEGGIEQNFEGPDDPDILLEEVNRAAGGGCDRQCFLAVASR
jgi:hypothetical protein